MAEGLRRNEDFKIEDFVKGKKLLVCVRCSDFSEEMKGRVSQTRASVRLAVHYRSRHRGIYIARGLSG
jgi:hypothetical protein